MFRVHIVYLDETIFTTECDSYTVSGSCMFVQQYKEKGRVSKQLETSYVIPVRNVKRFSIEEKE